MQNMYAMKKNCKIFLNFDTTFNYINYICSVKLI